MGNQNSAEVVRNDFGKLVEMAQKHAKEAGRTINILFLGEQGHGKSSTINTFLSALEGKKVKMAHAVTWKNDLEQDRTTLRYRAYTPNTEGGASFRFFDCPGMKVSGTKQVIDTVMEGIDDAEFVYDNANETVSIKSVTPNPKKKIDYVIWIIDAVQVSTPNTDAWRWNSWTISDDARARIMKDIFNQIFRSTNEDYFPFILFTKVDSLKGLNPDRLRKEAFKWCPGDDKFCLVNAIESNTSLQSESTVLSVLFQITEHLIRRKFEREN
eukprot:TRINITY_DN10619_c0_g1_i1.p1 TRINITY_DN10619_c0_g1~~TRINITY_DN10619_c0_g1_i1.p1  ORF type:complete len:269 (-),score=50.84 TRINITY_DN10619_c0_g1_i1:176-982(-)